VERALTVGWWLYIVRCTDDTLYTGITTDVARRLREHAGGVGAKFFRGRRPAGLVFLEGGHTRSSASAREAAVKRLRRPAKLALIASAANELSGV
jgi:putative endonuclease